MRHPQQIVQDPAQDLEFVRGIPGQEVVEDGSHLFVQAPMGCLDLLAHGGRS